MEAPPDTLSQEDLVFMRMAIEEAEQAGAGGDVPVGAVVVSEQGEILSRARNRREQSADPTAHAEVLALRDAAKRTGQWRLSGATLYVTKEPCIMCSGAMVNARIARVVFGCLDEKGGGALSLYRLLSDPRLNHRVAIVPGVLDEENRALLQTFFRNRRKPA